MCHINYDDTTLYPGTPPYPSCLPLLYLLYLKLTTVRPMDRTIFKISGVLLMFDVKI